MPEETGDSNYCVIHYLRRDLMGLFAHYLSERSMSDVWISGYASSSSSSFSPPTVGSSVPEALGGPTGNTTMSLPWNVDVLDLIISYLSPRDIASLALTNTFLMARAYPRLYSTLSFTFSMARGYPNVMTPFSTVAAHPELAMHVRHIDIRTIPFAGSKFSAVFLRQADQALQLCDNIVSFRCSANAVIAFIPILSHKRRLSRIRINVDTYPRVRCWELLCITHLSDLCLDWIPLHVANILPVWAIVLGQRLTSLTLFMSTSITEDLLKSTLGQLPGLLSLHVVGCPNLYHDVVLGLTSLTPQLQTLSVSAKFDLTSENQPLPLSLSNLQHLSIDVRLMSAPMGMSSELSAMTVATLLERIAELPNPPHLRSLRIRTPSNSSLHFILLSQLAALVSPTVCLESVAFVDCTLDAKGLSAFAKFCRMSCSLEVLELAVPKRELTEFARALQSSRSIRILRVPQQTLAQEAVHYIFVTVGQLEVINTKGGRWIMGSQGNLLFEASLPSDDLDQYWFSR